MLALGRTIVIVISRLPT